MYIVFAEQDIVFEIRSLLLRPGRYPTTMSPNASERRDDGGKGEEKTDPRLDVVDLCSSQESSVENSNNSACVEEQNSEVRASAKKRTYVDEVSSDAAAAASSAPLPKRARSSHHPGNFVDLTEGDDNDGDIAEKSKYKAKNNAAKNDNATCRSIDPSALSERAFNEPSVRTADGAAATPGIVALLHSLAMGNDVRSCGICCASSATSPAAARSMLLPMHYRQPDKWSCGYRNMQMVLSSLIPLLPSDHPYFDSQLSRRNNNEDPPSLRDLQGFLEQAWREGYDPEGAQHYRGRIQGKSKWIGAVEVASVLWYMSIDCAIVQFARRDESRKMLVDFVWNYFTDQSGFDVCKHADSAGRGVNVVDLARIILGANNAHGTAAAAGATGAFTSHASTQCIVSPLVPLYLQWEGHSVTIIGIERTAVSYNFLILDPMKDGQTTREVLRCGRFFGDDGASTVLDSIRLPASEVRHKDCQVVVCGRIPLSSNERRERIGVRGVDRFALTAGHHMYHI